MTSSNDSEKNGAVGSELSGGLGYPEPLKFHTAGMGGNETLYFFPGPSWCGAIRDGVSFGVGAPYCFVVDFKDLEAMYEAAKTARGKA